MLPKYFKNLHLIVTEITGKPQIVSLKPYKGIFKKYGIDIPKEEWISAMMTYYSSGQFKNTRQMLISTDYTFLIGGNVGTKENLIKALKSCIKELEERD